MPSEDDDLYAIATQSVDAIFYRQSLNPIADIQVGGYFEKYTATLERLGVSLERRNQILEMCINEYCKRLLKKGGNNYG